MAYGALIGGGAGYSHEFHFFKGAVFIEIGAIFGYFYYFSPAGQDTGLRFECAEYGPDGECLEQRQINDTQKGFAVVMLRPTLYLGKKWLFLSIGPRMAFGNSVVGGVAVGLMARF